jgi:hypothetical protein
LPVTLESLLPAQVAVMTGVPHEGRNSLLLFTHFAKVFYRPEDPALAGKELWGFNRNGPLVTNAVGPGYYVAYPHGQGEVLVDYTRLPGQAPSGWPAITPNGQRLSRFVYNGTKDVLRGVSKHVTIGRASRNGKDLDNWFILCRTEAAPTAAA